jgi:hypothetical protein
MSMETTKRVWQARLILVQQAVRWYSIPCAGRWGIFHAKPFVLNECQAGVAIEGIIHQERLETSLLAADTHGTSTTSRGHWPGCLALICVRGGKN